MIKRIVSLIILFIIFCSTLTVFADNSLYVWSSAVSEDAITTSALLNSREGNFLNLTCGSAVLMDQATGKILYDHNMHEQLRPASVTKVMTILLIMEALDNGRISLDSTVPCSEAASKMGGSQIWLDVSESLTVNDMLKAICVVSANDCAVQL